MMKSIDLAKIFYDIMNIDSIPPCFYKLSYFNILGSMSGVFEKDLENNYHFISIKVPTNFTIPYYLIYEKYYA